MSIEISPRKSGSNTLSPLDEWLHCKGFYRKHMPREPSCLFRAVSEQVYLTQYYHIKVRQECVAFMKTNRHLFEENIPTSFHNYIEQMSCVTEWGTVIEIQAMSLLYSREIVVFNGYTQSHNATSNGFDKYIYLCQTRQKHYESVYSKENMSASSYCQSLVYQILYKRVFQMEDVDEKVDKMLHTKGGSKRDGAKGHQEREVTLDNCAKQDEANEESDARGYTPFPYRVAKALDPNIYRNIDFDIWHELKREVKGMGWNNYGMELQVGSKCLVQIDKIDDDEENNNLSNDRDLCNLESEPVYFNGHIQKMAENEGPVVVFVEGLGVKKTVPFAAIKPLPPKKPKNPTTKRTDKNEWGVHGKSRNIPSLLTDHRWKRSWTASTRKTKEPGDANSYAQKQESNFKHEAYKHREATVKEAECQNRTFGTAQLETEKPQSAAADSTYPEMKFNAAYSAADTTTLCSPESTSDETNRPVNYLVEHSVDVNGNDLPLSDVATLRFFFNMGVTYFQKCRCSSDASSGQASNVQTEKDCEKDCNLQTNAPSAYNQKKEPSVKKTVAINQEERKDFAKESDRHGKKNIAPRFNRSRTFESPNDVQYQRNLRKCIPRAAEVAETPWMPSNLTSNCQAPCGQPMFPGFPLYPSDPSYYASTGFFGGQLMPHFDGDVCYQPPICPNVDNCASTYPLFHPPYSFPPSVVYPITSQASQDTWYPQSPNQPAFLPYPLPSISGANLSHNAPI